MRCAIRDPEAPGVATGNSVSCRRVDLPVQRVRAALHALEAADGVMDAAGLPAALLPWLAEAFCADLVVWTDDGPTPHAVTLRRQKPRDDAAVPPTAQLCPRPETPTITLSLDGGDGSSARVVLARSGAAFDAGDVELAEGLRPQLSHRVLALNRLGAARNALSSREQEVLDLVTTGLTDTAIAHRLGCRPRTVDKHLEHAYRALGVGNRAAAVARWMREGNPQA
jgi:DNA-binding CsgD family transcriptional regulator